MTTAGTETILGREVRFKGNLGKLSKRINPVLRPWEEDATVKRSPWGWVTGGSLIARAQVTRAFAVIPCPTLPGLRLCGWIFRVISACHAEMFPGFAFAVDYLFWMILSGCGNADSSDR